MLKILGNFIHFIPNNRFSFPSILLIIFNVVYKSVIQQVASTFYYKLYVNHWVLTFSSNFYKIKNRLKTFGFFI